MTDYSTGDGFTSVFATDLDDYVAFKAAMGFTGRSRIWYLKQFDAYCTRHQATTLDRVIIEGTLCGTSLDEGRRQRMTRRAFGRRVTGIERRAGALDTALGAVPNPRQARKPGDGERD